MLRGRYSDNHPDVVRLRADIEKVKRVEEQRTGSGRRSAAPKVAPPAADPPRGSRARANRRNWRARANRSPGCRRKSRARIRNWRTARPSSSAFCAISTSISAASSACPCANRKWPRSRATTRCPRRTTNPFWTRKWPPRWRWIWRGGSSPNGSRCWIGPNCRKSRSSPSGRCCMRSGRLCGLALGLVVGFSAELRQNVVLGEWELPEGTPVLARLPFIEVPLASDRTNRRPAAMVRPQERARQCLRHIVVSGGRGQRVPELSSAIGCNYVQPVLRIAQSPVQLDARSGVPVPDGAAPGGAGRAYVRHPGAQGLRGPDRKRRHRQDHPADADFDSTCRRPAFSPASL